MHHLHVPHGRLPGVKLAKGKKVAELGYGVSENSKQCADWGAKSIEKYGNDIGGAEGVYTAPNLDFGLPERHRARRSRP